MKRLLALLPLALAACNQQPGGEPVTRIEFGKNGEAKAEPTPTPTPPPGIVSACESVTFEGTALTHCTADPDKHRIRTVLGADGKPFRGLEALAAALPEGSHVAFAMNAGMFDGAGEPIGYYVEEAERLHELNRNDGPGNFHMKPNGVFYGTDSEWRVRTADDFYANVRERPDFGTQSGPMLVIEGKLHAEISQDGPSRTIRNGVGVDAKGRAHFVISEAPVSFGKFARYFRDVLKTPNALYLDGGVSALWNPAAGRIDGGAPIGPILLVEERQPASGK